MHRLVIHYGINESSRISDSGQMCDGITIIIHHYGTSALLPSSLLYFYWTIIENPCSWCMLFLCMAYSPQTPLRFWSCWFHVECQGWGRACGRHPPWRGPNCFAINEEYWQTLIRRCKRRPAVLWVAEILPDCSDSDTGLCDKDSTTVCTPITQCPLHLLF